MRAVVSNRGCAIEIHGRQRRRQRVQLQHQQTEPADVRRPAAQVPHEIFFELVGGNFVAQIRKRAGRARRARAAHVIREPRVRAVVIQKRPDVEQVVDVVAERFQIAGKLRRPVDVAVDHMERRNAGRAKRPICRAPGDFIEIRADDNQRVLIQGAPAGRPFPHDRIQVREQRTVPRAHVANAARLLVDGPIENLDDDFIELLEIRLMSAAASPHIHRTIHHRLEPARVDARNARIAEQQRRQRAKQRQVRHRDAVRARDLCRIPAAARELHPVLGLRNPSGDRQQIEQAHEARGVAVERADVDGAVFEAGEHPVPRQRHHRRTDEHAVKMAAHETANVSGHRLRVRGDAPAVSRALDELAQRRNQRLVGGAKDVVLEDQRLRQEERRELAVQRRRQRHGDAAFGGQYVGRSVRGSVRCRARLLGDPSAGGEQPKRHAQVARVRARPFQNFRELERACGAGEHVDRTALP